MDLFDTNEELEVQKYLPSYPSVGHVLHGISFVGRQFYQQVGTFGKFQPSHRWAD